MKLFCFSMTSPATVIDYLKSNNKTFYVPVMNFNEAELDNGAEFIFLLAYTDFIKHLNVLNTAKYKNKCIILFAPVVRARELIGANVLDVFDLQPKLNQPFRFKTADFKTLVSDVAPKKVSIKDEQYLPMLINNALTGSLLTKLMTLIYKIPNSKIQNEHRDRIIHWFVQGDKKISTIKNIVDNIKQEEVRDSIFNLIKDSKNYKDVFMHISELNSNKKPISYSKIAEKFAVNEFDLRYMISVASKAKFGDEMKNVNIQDHYYSHDRNNGKHVSHATKPDIPVKKLKKVTKKS